ncbi:MAG: hypothetical protein CGU28_12340 [Candidatus Dactylopiibacterium carminicum]|nr:MAG: hypothetical protein CGU28_12340 [Candidatus Dactylopiibacterium carminicum]
MANTKMISGYLAVAGALLVLSSGAQAVTVDWGVNDTSESQRLYSSLFSSSPYNSTFTFSLQSLSDLLASFTTGLTGSGSVGLFSADNTQIGSFSFGGTYSTSSLTFSSLGAGDYYYTISGAGYSPIIGANFSSTLTPVSAVPKPGSLAMLLAGLGMVGLLARRRTA